jgi:hypothetical protein
MPIDGGTLALALFVERETVAGAVCAPDSVTTQFDVPGALTVAGEQIRPLT